jgi:hypothetical protein
MGEAFESLEQMKGEGLLSTGYGVSSNLNGCKWSVTGVENDYESVSLKTLHEQATPSFMSAQVPLNLLESGIISSEKSELSDFENFSIMSNRPLHAIPPPGVWAGGDWERHQEFV